MTQNDAKSNKKTWVMLLLLIAADVFAVNAHQKDMKKHPRPQIQYEEYSDPQTPASKTPVLDFFKAKLGHNK